MEGLNKFTEYTVRVLAINRYGPGTASETAIVTTQSDGEFHLQILQLKHFVDIPAFCNLIKWKKHHIKPQH